MVFYGLFAYDPSVGFVCKGKTRWVWIFLELNALSSTEYCCR